MNTKTISFSLESNYDEFRVWTQKISPILGNLPTNVRDILEYISTEILNNAREHSAASTVSVEVSYNRQVIYLKVSDNGVGIFHKIGEAFGLDYPLDAAIELLKGKTTTDRQHHSGEGVFFSIQSSDEFSIWANGHQLTIDKGMDDNIPLKVEFAAEQPRITEQTGTSICIGVKAQTPRTIEAVFDTFCPRASYRFIRTRFLMALAATEGNLVARSQAKRIMAGMDRFERIDLDFETVPRIGQGFADEAFRVWHNQHPQCIVKALNTTTAVESMIRHVGADQVLT